MYFPRNLRKGKVYKNKNKMDFYDFIETRNQTYRRRGIRVLHLDYDAGTGNLTGRG